MWILSRWWTVALFYSITSPFLVLSNDSMFERIVDGVPVEEGEFDFFGIPSPFFCGGSLIHPQVFLTAAHCQCSYVETATEIHFGSIYRLNPETALDIVPLSNERVVHPGYRSSTLENDLLMLKLERPAKSEVVPAVWATSQPSSGNPVTAIGFGAIRQGGPGSRELLKVTVPVVGFSTCNSRSYYDGSIFEDEMLCAGETGRDACQGDSGGPLLNEQGEIVGITSWGIGCALENRPGVYTNVANYNTFIRQGICALADDRPAYCDSLNFGNIQVETDSECREDGGGGDDVCTGDFLSCLLDLFLLFATSLLTCACG